jgi:CRP/FNR family cyclic AMP-dependent transcriptional regulator
MPMELAKITLFEGLPEPALRALAGRSSLRTLPPDALVVREGEHPDALYVVLKGRVRVFLTDEKGAELVLTTKGPGEYFGEMMLDDRPRSASVATLERTELGVIPREQFTAFLLEQPQVALRLIRDLIRVSRGMNVRSREELTSREKLRRYVAELEERNVRNDPGVRRWEYAKRTVLGLLLAFAILQFYFSDTLLQMLQLGGTTVFVGH